MSRNVFQGMQANAQMGVWEFDLVAWQVTWTPEVYWILGLDPGTYVPDARDFEQFLLPEEMENVLSQITLVLESGQDFAFDTQIMRPTGEVRFVHSRGKLIRAADGQPHRFVGTLEDITERRLAEKALRESDAQMRLLVEGVKDYAIIMLDSLGRIVTWNPGAERIQGYPSDEIVGQHFSRFYTAEDVTANRPQRNLQLALEQGRFEEEALRVRKDGSRYWAQVTITAIFDRHNRHLGFANVTRDITERKRAEEEHRQLEAQLQHAQKLESLGVLAGGIAHDFNNLLTSVLGYANLAQMQLPNDSPARSMLREIEKAALRAADLTKQMLAYSGKAEFVIQRMRLDALVEEMAQLLRTVVSRKATVLVYLEPAIVEIDSTQIRQVVMNLITNASDALGEEEGMIHIRTGVRHADAAQLRSPFFPDELPEGEYAYVEVEDTGCGMSAETLARIFDPFFTTKFTGRGLGLAAVLGIVRGHRGTIKVTSTPGQGTLFQVLLPSASEQPAEKTASDARGGPPAGQGTVLVIEDEAGIRHLTKYILESAGFQVRTAEDGLEGLKMFSERAQEIVAVLLDLTMPRLDGRDVLRELRQLAPGVVVVVMSGYSEQEVGPLLEGSGASGFLQKPFHPGDLLARITQLLPEKTHSRQA